MHKLEANEIVWTTFYTINKIKEYKNWWDVLLLYFAYIEQSRIQETNQSWSLDVFMMKKMWWGKRKLQNAKKVLKNLWLIDVIQVRNKKTWKISTYYVKTNFIINEDKLKTKNIVYNIDFTWSPIIHPQDNPPAGEWTPNALSIKTKCLKHQKEIGEQKKMGEMLSIELVDIKERWNAKKIISRKKIKKFAQLPKIRLINKKLSEIYKSKRKEYSKEEILEWIKNYINDIINRKEDEGWYYNHRFDLMTFLKQSNWLDKFININ